MDNSEKCSVDDCDRPKTYKHFCRMHYERTRSGKDMSLPPNFRIPPGAKCVAPECDRRQGLDGLCVVHRKRKGVRVGKLDPIRTPTPGVWGDWKITADGYVRRTRVVDGVTEYQIQHRLVMEEVIGRGLSDDESVHHKNGDRADNRPENLELWSRYQPAGQRVEDKVKWALEIIDRYGHLSRQLQRQLDLNRTLLETAQ